jgi:dihydroorotase/N-acyl-D-amino-acid deacylase
MTGTSVLFPQWSLEGGHAALEGRLRDPSQRARLKRVVIERILTDRGGGDPRNIVMADCPFEPSLNGKDLAAITASRGLAASVENAAETVMELQRRGGCAAIYHAFDERDVERILRFPFTMVASDGEIPVTGRGVPHPRSYGTFARVLGRYVRERGILTLEEAVRKMTSLPAWRLGLKDRGLLRPGMKADLVVFDAASIADQATFQNPRQYATGVRHLFVNGRPVILSGEVTTERPGRVLRGPGYRAPRTAEAA